MHAPYAPLRLDPLEPCPRLAGLLGLLATTAQASVWMLAIPWLRVPLAALVAAWAGIAVCRHGLRRGKGALTGLLLERDGQICARFGGDGRWHEVTVERAFVGIGLVVAQLSLPAGHRRCAVCLTRGAVGPSRWRQLRAGLHLRFPGG